MIGRTALGKTGRFGFVEGGLSLVNFELLPFLS